MSISKEKFDDEDLESTKSYSFDGSSSSRQGSFLLDDVESQRIALPLPAEGAEYSVATRTKLLYLAGYFALNLCLTLYNKAALQKFNFPWLVTALHTSCVAIGSSVMLLGKDRAMTTLSGGDNLKLAAFSLLFTLNIAISNVSLALVSVPFHQIMRSACPLFTVLLYRLVYSRSYLPATYISLAPIVLGVGLATFGDLYFTLSGFLLTLLGVILASVKTVITNKLMTGTLKLSAMELLYRMAPLAAVQSIFCAYLTGEFQGVARMAAENSLSPGLLLALAGNGLLAFVLNISSFQTNKLAGALTITVAGNVKQCLTILLGIVAFNVEVSRLNGVGMMVTLLGAAWYSWVELSSRERAR